MIEKILAIIPARGGSKRLPGKNIMKFCGKPMIAYAIRATKGLKYINHVVVSTDDKSIAKISQKYGAEVPFRRSAKLAADRTPTLPVLQHAVSFYEKEKGFRPDIIVLIQPTNPLVRTEDVDGALKTLFRTRTNSCFSVTEISQRPEWMYFLNKKPKLFLPSVAKTKRSQDLPKLGVINGAVYVMKYDTLMKKNKIRDEKTSVYVMPRERTADIDDIFDFEMAEFLMKKYGRK